MDGMTSDLYYIQDTGQVVGNSAVWWRGWKQGYTCDLRQALKLEKEDARLLWLRATDVLRLCSEMDALAETHVDVQKLREVSHERKAGV